MIDALPLLLGPEGYQISRSVRLRSNASATFSRTPGSASNRRTWTWSAWVKRGQLATTLGLFSANQAKDNITGLYLGSSDKFVFIDRPGGVTNALLISTMVLRDPSAWYHIIFQADTTNATSSDRLKLYVNGVRVTAFDSATYPSQNYELNYINNTVDHRIGAFQDNTPLYFDGYLTEINFIDGQALTPSSFGETDVLTGVWKPKKYAGTYGTNGFFLNFSDNSNNTAATIGKDYSGNGNNWTPNNISVTSGSTYDSMLDVPTPWADGGNGRGNYAVLNPLSLGSTVTLSNANLTMTEVGTYATTVSSIAMTSGKWYAEMTVGSNTFAGTIGIAKLGYASTSRLGFQANTWSYNNDGGLYYNSNTLAVVSSYTTNDVIGIAFDADNLTITFYKNNVQQGTQYTAANSGLTAGEFYFATGHINSTSNWNFGQRPFAYTPPSGFKALNTLNLPTPTILKGNQYMDVVLYTGNAVQDRAVTGFGFDLDLAWIKSRNNAGSHVLVNREVGGDKQLFSNLTNAEQTNSDVTNGFTTGGILVGDNLTGTGSTNQNTYTYALWGWKEGATQGFDIVTYTGTGANRTVAHNLGVAPSMIIVKDRSNGTPDWAVYHQALGNTKYLSLNTTGAAATSVNFWNNTSPTSSVFTVGIGGSVNNNTENYVAYLFAEVAGFSKFGSYTGNGSTDGPFVFCGFRPRFIMFKRTDSSASWRIIDTAREAVNATQNEIYPNLSNAEAGAANGMDILSNGFKLRGSYAEWNASGGTYVFAAFAESPFKNSLAR